jgi:hypothetical protein
MPCRIIAVRECCDALVGRPCAGDAIATAETERHTPEERLVVGDMRRLERRVRPDRRGIQLAASTGLGVAADIVEPDEARCRRDQQRHGVGIADDDRVVARRSFTAFGEDPHAHLVSELAFDAVVTAAGAGHDERVVVVGTHGCGHRRGHAGAKRDTSLLAGRQPNGDDVVRRAREDLA